MVDADLGEVLNTWLFPIRELRRQRKAELEKLSEDDKLVRMAEWNVQRSVDTLRGNQTVKRAMSERGLALYGAVYDVATGEMRMLDVDASSGGSANFGLWSPR